MPRAIYGRICTSYLRPMRIGATKYVDLVLRSGFSGTLATIFRSAGFRLLTISVWQTVRRTASASPLTPLIAIFTPVSRGFELTVAPSTKSM